MTPAGIEPATFRSVAQHLNHCATAPQQLYITLTSVASAQIALNLNNMTSLFYLNKIVRHFQPLIQFAARRGPRALFQCTAVNLSGFHLLYIKKALESFTQMDRR